MKSLSTAKTTVSGRMWWWFQTVAMKSNDCLAVSGERKTHFTDIITQLVLATLLWRRSTLMSMWNWMSSWYDGQQTWKSVVEVRTTSPAEFKGLEVPEAHEVWCLGICCSAPALWTPFPESSRCPCFHMKDTQQQSRHNKVPHVACKWLQFKPRTLGASMYWSLHM